MTALHDPLQGYKFVDIATIADMPLAECLSLAGRVFDLEAIAGRRIDQQGVAEYYRQSDQGYDLFHSGDGALHLAMNRDGRFDPAGYYSQADYVARQLEQLGARRVLEAGCGKGFNTVYLARKFPDCSFVGVDLTESHIAASRLAAAGVANAEFIRGDYETLDFTAESFDIVLGVETFCQTSHIERALANLHRVVRPGGRLVNVDCFRKRPLDGLEPDLQMAAALVEKTTAVDAFAIVDDWLGLARLKGWDVLEVNDESATVAHNLDRLYRLARQFFDDPKIVQASQQAFPPLLLQNAICGLLMPFAVGEGVLGYYSLALERR